MLWKVALTDFSSSLPSASISIVKLRFNINQPLRCTNIFCVDGGKKRFKHLMKFSSYVTSSSLESFQVHLAINIYVAAMNFCVLKIFFYGPVTPWIALLQARMKFPQDYPYSPPSIRFLTKVWHPNVYEVSKDPLGPKKSRGASAQPYLPRWSGPIFRFRHRARVLISRILISERGSVH